MQLDDAASFSFCHNDPASGLPGYGQNATNSFQPPFEEMVILGSDGHQWRALRQPLGGGVYRTPDDPTTPEDFTTVGA
jgi:hypothetical protein